MPPVQTSYGDMSASVAGQIADMTPKTCISRTVETGAGVGFGAPVSQGTADKGCIAYTDNLVGITVRERSVAAEQDGFIQYDSARLLVKGAIWAVADVAVDAGDAVYITSSGTFTNVSTDNDLIPGARWDTSTGAVSLLAVIRID